MKKQKGKKSNAQLIIGALLSGNSLRSRDISDMVSEMAGKEIKVQDVASMLSKISNTKKSDLGYFIKRVKDGNSFTYNIVEEALALSEKQAYDLTLKIGKDRYTLEQAFEDFPGLRKYTEIGAKTKVRPAKVRAKKAADKKATAKPAAEVVETAAKPELAVSDKLAEMIRKQIEEQLGSLDLNLKVTLKLED